MPETTGSQLRLLVLTAEVDGAGTVHSDGLAEVWRSSVDLDRVPSGVLHQGPDGAEELASVDGYRLVLDGRGGVQVWDAAGVRVPITGFFYVKP